jgi:stress-induced morphogen
MHVACRRGIGLPKRDAAVPLPPQRESADIAGMTIDRATRIQTLLTDAFAPTVLQIQDDSARHAGHSEAQPGGQTHYSVLMVSDAFAGMTRIARSRAVHTVLEQEFGPAEVGGMHALALTLRTLQEHEKLK